MIESAPTVVVGIDGSAAAANAARWAVDEAISRDIALRLVYVIDSSQSVAAGPEGPLTGRLAAARSALHDAHRGVEATGKSVKVETDILRGTALTKLIEESRTASMICVGAIGLDRSQRGAGSVAAALAVSALCPVAVIRRPAGRLSPAAVSRVVVPADNPAALHYAFEEARLRQAPLRVISVSRAGGADDTDGTRSAQAQLSRRIARWTRSYPDVRVESAIVRGSLDRYLAANEEVDQLFVTDAHACVEMCGARYAGRSVVAVRSRNL